MSTSASQAQSRPKIAATPAVSITMQALAALLFGFFIVGMAGFSHLDVMHNASHDTRHSNGFPCH